jgi:protein arginine kinase
MGIATRGFFGEFSDVVGNFFQLSNVATMGASEAEFIESTSKVIREIIGYERTARERLLRDAPLEIGDKVCRACGILYSARLLGLAELLNLASAIRFGIESGVYTGHTVNDINKIILAAMPAHLQLQIIEKKMDSYDDLDAARADMVRVMFGTKKAPAKKKAPEKAKEKEKAAGPKKTAVQKKSA